MYTSDRVSCGSCGDGHAPNTARSACDPCPDGMAGVDGICEQCPLGAQPRIDMDTRQVIADRCVDCTETSAFNSSRGWVSATGVSCEACPAGRAPNAESTVCDVCVPGKFSDAGLDCQYCAVGLEPNTIMFDAGATHCLVCVNGTHRHNDESEGALDMQSCSTCAPGQQPNADADDCDGCGDGVPRPSYC
jgi:hypothetical protein